MNYRFKCRRATAAQWTTSNEVLLNGEIGYETDTNSFKFGDGVTAWNDIADYFTVDSGGGGVTDHGALTGLADDDHTQYLNVARGDARYYTETESDALLAGKETAGAAATAQANAIATASSDATTKANAAQAAAISAASTDATTKANAAQSAAISAAATDATTKANAAQAAAIAASDPVGSAAAAQAASQPLDSDLTAIAALVAVNDDILQRKAGAWTNRTMAQLASDLSLSGTNTGDQTSIVGITGTIAQFNTACTDADFTPIADPSHTGTITIDSDLKIMRDAANISGQRNGTNPQQSRIYKTYTDSSNYSRFYMGFSSGDFVIGSEHLGTGTVNQMHLKAQLHRFYVGSSASTAAWFINADGSFTQEGSTGAFISVKEMTAPSAPATNAARIYAEDNGSGKTRLMVRFATGAVQQLAIEP